MRDVYETLLGCGGEIKIKEHIFLLSRAEIKITDLHEIRLVRHERKINEYVNTALIKIKE